MRQRPARCSVADQAGATSCWPSGPRRPLGFRDCAPPVRWLRLPPTHWCLVHDSPRQPRGGVAGRSSGPPGGGRAGPSQPLGLSSAPSRLLAVARGRAAAGLAGCAVSWRKIGVLTGARGDGLPRLAFGCAAAAKFALLAAGWLHLLAAGWLHVLVALWARATPSSELDTAAMPEVPSPM